MTQLALDHFTVPLHHKPLSFLLVVCCSSCPTIHAGQLLRDARCCRGWTIEYAAEKLGVSWTILSQWERNKQVPHTRNFYIAAQLYQNKALLEHFLRMAEILKENGITVHEDIKPDSLLV